MWSSFLILYCNLKCSNAPFRWSSFVVYGSRNDQNLGPRKGQLNPDSPLVIARPAVPSCTSFRRCLESLAESWAYTTFGHGLCTIFTYRMPVYSQWITHGSLTGPAGLLDPMGILRAPYDPLRLIVLVFPSYTASTQSGTVLVCAHYRTGRVNVPFQGGTSVLVPYCHLFLLSVFIIWFTYYVSDIF